MVIGVEKSDTYVARVVIGTYLSCFSIICRRGDVTWQIAAGKVGGCWRLEGRVCNNIRGFAPHATPPLGKWQASVGSASDPFIEHCLSGVIRNLKSATIRNCSRLIFSFRSKSMEASRSVTNSSDGQAKSVQLSVCIQNDGRRRRLFDAHNKDGMQSLKVTYYLERSTFIPKQALWWKESERISLRGLYQSCNVNKVKK